MIGRLLQVMSEEEAFWTFTSIVENIMPPNYYQGMLGARID